jgi:hypothetical protein
MSPEAWDGLPWWEQKMYLDGYEWEGLIERSGSVSTDPNVVSQKTYRTAEGTSVTDTKTAQVLDFTPGAFANYGIPETTME